MTPDEYIEQLDEPRRSQIRELHELIRETAPELTPHLQYGMLGYGSYHYVYASGREGDAPILGLASHKRYISLYACPTSDGRSILDDYRERLPKADIGKSCVRFKALVDLDRETLEDLIRRSATWPS